MCDFTVGVISSKIIRLTDYQKGFYRFPGQHII